MSGVIGAKADWYDHAMNLRAALERRGEFIKGENIFKAVRRMHRPEMVREYIEAQRMVHAIPEGEVYGNERGSGSG